MKINVCNARKQFLEQSALQRVYIEAVANAFDVNASIIDIDIKIDSFAVPDSLTITTKDNGEGFTDKRFKKFSKLLEIEDQKHKGLG